MRQILLTVAVLVSGVAVADQTIVAVSNLSSKASIDLVKPTDTQLPHQLKAGESIKKVVDIGDGATVVYTDTFDSSNRCEYLLTKDNPQAKVIGAVGCSVRHYANGQFLLNMKVGF